jgi:predicted RNase H-like HicB family nuclease
MSELIFLVEEDLEGEYTAKSLGTSIFTDGDTLEALKVNIKEAVHCHFEEENLPKIIRLHLIKEEILTL